MSLVNINRRAARLRAARTSTKTQRSDILITRADGSREVAEPGRFEKPSRPRRVRANKDERQKQEERLYRVLGRLYQTEMLRDTPHTPRGTRWGDEHFLAIGQVVSDHHRFPVANDPEGARAHFIAVAEAFFATCVRRAGGNEDIDSPAWVAQLRREYQQIVNPTTPEEKKKAKSARDVERRDPGAAHADLEAWKRDWYASQPVPLTPEQQVERKLQIAEFLRAVHGLPARQRWALERQINGEPSSGSTERNLRMQARRNLMAAAERGEISQFLLEEVLS